MSAVMTKYAQGLFLESNFEIHVDVQQVNILRKQEIVSPDFL